MGNLQQNGATIAWSDLQQYIIGQWRGRLRACTTIVGRHFKHFMHWYKNKYRFMRYC